MELQLREHLWTGLSIWIALYISDYYFTIACARLYRSGVNEKIVFGGSYELTPYFQADIDSLRKFSPRFFWALLLSLFGLSLVWFLASSIQLLELYSFLLGAMLLLQLAVHIRHMRNFLVFRAIAKSDAVRGRIEYSRFFSLRQSSYELMMFSALFAILALVTYSVFVLGGVLSCASTAAKHWKLAKTAARAASASA